MNNSKILRKLIKIGQSNVVLPIPKEFEGMLGEYVWIYVESDSLRIKKAEVK